MLIAYKLPENFLDPPPGIADHSDFVPAGDVMKMYQKFYLIVLIFLAMNCASTRTYPPHEEHRSRDSYRAEAQKGMISTAHPLATKAGIEMMKKGGNAMDAAVAASFMISVVRPQSTGIGGGGFMLYFDSSSKNTNVYDFRERAPLRATQNMYLDRQGNPKDFYYRGNRIPNASVNGHLSVGTPGLVAGLIKSHQKYGKLPLADVIAPAIKTAEEGFPVYKSLASSLERRKEVLNKFEGSMQIFFKDGRPLRLGEILVQKDLAWTLRQIQKKGVDGFYKGEVKNRILKEIRRGRGILSSRDFDAYEVKERNPVRGKYRDHEIVSMPPPSSGGVHIVQMLNILEGFNLKKMGHNSAKSVHIISETMRRAFADRAKYLGDSDFVKVPVRGLVSKRYATKLRGTIQKSKASKSKLVEAGNPIPYESSSTTHLSVVDQWGNAVSSTQTINYSFGSCVVAQGTGIVLNDEMDDFSKKPGEPNVFGLIGSYANSIAAKKTMLSSMSPTLVFDKESKLKLVVGSPGGPRIINATLQTIINTIDYDMDLEDAVHAYRIHHQWFPDEIRMEKDGLSSEVQEELKQMGHTVTVKSAIGDVQAIAKENGKWIGVTDTRSEGAPLGF